MFLIKLYRFIVGSVVFEAYGGFGERFINLCCNRGIEIRDTKLNKNKIKAIVKADEYKYLRSIAKRSGMKLKAIKKYGIPFFVMKHKNRVGLLIGGILFSVLLFLSTFFIWSIDVTGGENISHDQIIEIMQTLGVKEGELRKNIDVKDVSEKAMQKLSSKVSWLSVNIKGTHANIEVRDYKPRKKDETYSSPCNIIADFDGLLLTASVTSGKKICKEGGGVNKGDILISGIVENRDTSSQFMEARGVITALHNVELKAETAATVKGITFENAKKSFTLSLFGIKVPLVHQKDRSEDFLTFQTEKKLKYANVVLPFSVIETTTVHKTEYTGQKNLSGVTADRFAQQFYEKFKNTLVLSSEISFKTQGETVALNSTSKCIDFMGKKQKISIE